MLCASSCRTERTLDVFIEEEPPQCERLMRTQLQEDDTEKIISTIIYSIIIYSILIYSTIIYSTIIIF